MIKLEEYLNSLERFAELLKETHEYKKHSHTDNPDKCERCYEYKKIPYTLKLCDNCQEQLKQNFPEKYEEARLENIRLYDEDFKRKII